MCVDCRVSTDVDMGHWFGVREIERPTLVLYAPFASASFNGLHTVLKELVTAGRINYLYRHVVEKGADSNPVFLSGYGVELQIKSTEYKAVDGLSLSPLSLLSLRFNMVGTQ